MHYLSSCDIYLSKTYHLSVYDITYETLGHTHPGFFTAADKGECSPTMELERNYVLTLPIIHTEKLYETHKIFCPKKSFRNQSMVGWDTHSVTVTHFG